MDLTKLAYSQKLQITHEVLSNMKAFYERPRIGNDAQPIRYAEVCKSLLHSRLMINIYAHMLNEELKASKTPVATP